MQTISQEDRRIFENLFILEAANNHQGSVERGLEIIRQHGAVVRQNNVRAAIKLQFRDMEEFVHPDFKGSKDIKYIQKTELKTLTKAQYRILIDEIKNVGCVPMSTPFDEASVDLCVEFDLPIIKIASSDMNDWPLIEKIASTRRPVIVSSGGASEKDLDDIVAFFEKRTIPLCVNHCVSLYPSEDHELHLDQIDYLKTRFPGNVIGLSTHEYHDWESSMFISYAKGARSWERHIDIESDDLQVQSYCSLPHQCDEWFRAFHKASTMCGGISTQRRSISRAETTYLDALVRGIYARENLVEGLVVNKENFDKYFFLAIPLLKGQLSCREIINGKKIIMGINKNEPLSIDNVDGPYSHYEILREKIQNRGM
jgi:sialic acid synthase SpsE